MNKSLLLPLLVVLSLNSQASWLDRLRADLSKDIYTSFHGEGLPLVVGSTETGLQYRQNFINQNRITSKVDEYGIVQFDNNDVGIALLKKGNDDHAFLNILDKRNYVKMDEWRNGPQFLKALKKYTKDYGCIPKITSLSHGWASGDRPGEGSGLSGNRGMNGLYATSKDLPGLLARAGARSLGKDLREDIEDGDIQFCGTCVAQFYACNISAKFAKTFSEVTGCQTVVATGQNSPYFQSFETEEDKQKVYRGSHYWKSAAGVWSERHTDAQRAKGQRKASWYRSTPVKNAQGEVVRVSEENLGEKYIAL